MKKTLFVITYVAVLFFTLQHDARAGNRSGTVSGQFLKIGLSARAIGMGGAQVAVADGVQSMGYNPAGILSVNNYGFAATYTAWLAGIQHSYAGVVKTIPGVGSIGASVILLTTDDIEENTVAFPEGTGRTFRASDFAFSLAYARHIGVSLTNIGKDVQFINEAYSLPTALRFGVLVDVLRDPSNQFVSTFQVTRLNDADEQYNVGGEYTFSSIVALRMGWKFSYDQEDVTAGFGLRLNSVGLNGMLDYGFNNFKYLPGTHSFTLELQF
ncbi:MAG: hypothetical protein HY033_04655 [Ignavibacteriae bacterium]|nr:hypothetical protein [Ignavibacteriota bacterium]